MKFAISNLALDNESLRKVVPNLANVGLQGIEIAPTSIWSDIENLEESQVLNFREFLNENNLRVSGIQSLFFGFPQLQLFVKNTWPTMRARLERMIRICNLLGGEIVVFGSPKNRIKGSLSMGEANKIAKEFFESIVPVLEENRVCLTLEPNAPEYGSDFLVKYNEVVDLCEEIDSKWIQPQIDTGCLWMVEQAPESAFSIYEPRHIHLSTPNLDFVPGDYDFDPLAKLVKSSNYQGWLVLEMLGSRLKYKEQVNESINWLIRIMRDQ